MFKNGGDLILFVGGVCSGGSGSSSQVNEGARKTFEGIYTGNDVRILSSKCSKCKTDGMSGRGQGFIDIEVRVHLFAVFENGSNYIFSAESDNYASTVVL